jgi:hypothetical protein
MLLLASSSHYSSLPLKHEHLRVNFTEAEDNALRQAIEQHGISDWFRIAAQLPGRNERQCRERWINYLSPTIINSAFTLQDDTLLLRLVATFGRKWWLLSQKFFPGRTNNFLKNRFKLLMRKSAKGVAVRYEPQEDATQSDVDEEPLFPEYPEGANYDEQGTFPFPDGDLFGSGSIFNSFPPE